MPHATASEELEVAWGSSGLIIRHAFVSEVTMRPGKGSSKAKISFWDAKKMLEKLGVQFDHARTMSKSNQDVVLTVRLYFFKADTFNDAYSIVSGQPNNSVFAQGNAVEIHITEVVAATPPSPLAVDAPADFDQHMRGCRIDTIHIKGLPAKWFDVNTSSFLDDDSASAASIYMQDQHALHQLFSTFGPLSAIDVVPSAAAAAASDAGDAASTISTSQFDLYVQFKTYEGVQNALSNLSGGESRVLCHTSHVKLFVPLVAHVDTTEYLSDAKIRQRRFAREQRLHDQQAKAAAAIAAEKARQASVEQAAVLVGALGDDLDDVAADAIKLSVALADVKAAAASYAALKDAPSMEQVALVRAALDVVRKQVDSAVRDKAEKEAAAQRAAWAKQVNKAAATARESKLARLQKQLAQAKDKYATYIAHVAVVADVAAADDALAVAMASATTTHTAQGSLNSADDVRTCLSKLDEDVDEAVHSVEAVVERLEVVSRFYAQAAVVDTWSKDVPADVFQVNTQLRTIQEEAWGDSTDDLARRLDHLDKVIEAVDALRELVARHSVLGQRIPSNSGENDQDDDDEKARALRQRLDQLGNALQSVTDPDELPDLDAQLTQLDAAITVFQQEEAQRLADESSLAAQMHRIRAARKRLASWREEHGVATKEYSVQRVAQHADRFASEAAAKRPRQVKFVSSRGRLASSVWIKDNETGAMMAPKTEEERQVHEMEVLRIQVIESQRRKEAEAAAQVAREAELRALVLQSMKRTSK